VLACELVLLFSNDKHFGRTKFQKALYLCEQHARLDFETSYLQKAAGPLDTKFFYSFLEEMEKENWVIETYKETPKGLMSQFELGENVSVILKQFPLLFENVREQVKAVYVLLKDANTKQAEALATVYAVWNNRIIRQQPASPEEIVNDFYEWHANKREFSKNAILEAYRGLLSRGITPVGFGKLIQKDMYVA
jgi:hypothetical protein